MAHNKYKTMILKKNKFLMMNLSDRNFLFKTIILNLIQYKKILKIYFQIFYKN